jgi:spore coat polysaccharide biosynthesis protein SpsF
LWYACDHAVLPSEREHVTPWMRAHPELVAIKHVKNDEDLSGIRLTLDTPEDYRVIEAMCKALDPAFFLLADIVACLRKHPDLLMINSKFERDEKMKQQQQKEREMT